MSNQRPMARSCLIVVLAAGEGTRMRSRVPKVLHLIAGRSLLGHVLTVAGQGQGARVAVVAGPDHEAIAVEAKRFAPTANVFLQRERRGTAHAVLAARKELARRVDDVLIVFVDSPLVSPETLGRLRLALAYGAGVVVFGLRV